MSRWLSLGASACSETEHDPLRFVAQGGSTAGVALGAVVSQAGLRRRAGTGGSRLERVLIVAGSRSSIGSEVIVVRIEALLFVALAACSSSPSELGHDLPMGQAEPTSIAVDARAVFWMAETGLYALER